MNNLFKILAAIIFFIACSIISGILQILLVFIIANIPIIIHLLVTLALLYIILYFININLLIFLSIPTLFSFSTIGTFIFYTYLFLFRLDQDIIYPVLNNPYVKVWFVISGLLGLLILIFKTYAIYNNRRQDVNSFSLTLYMGGIKTLFTTSAKGPILKPVKLEVKSFLKALAAGAYLGFCLFQLCIVWWAVLFLKT